MGVWSLERRDGVRVVRARCRGEPLRRPRQQGGLRRPCRRPCCRPSRRRRTEQRAPPPRVDVLLRLLRCTTTPGHRTYTTHAHAHASLSHTSSSSSSPFPRALFLLAHPRWLTFPSPVFFFFSLNPVFTGEDARVDCARGRGGWTAGPRSDSSGAVRPRCGGNGGGWARATQQRHHRSGSRPSSSTHRRAQRLPPGRRCTFFFPLFSFLPRSLHTERPSPSLPSVRLLVCLPLRRRPNWTSFSLVQSTRS